MRGERWYDAFPADPAHYWSLWINYKGAQVGACQSELQAGDEVLLFADCWLTLSILAAWLVKRLDEWGRVPWLVKPLLYLVGYGPLLCAFTVAGYVAEFRGQKQTWEKTEKVGRVRELAM